jgi:uncharacterized protein involved in outer membrane biogenesis
MSKILLSIFSVFILIILALLIIPSFIDWSQYKDQIKAQVAQATGYELDLNGELRAAFLPTPHMNVNNVAVNGENAKGPVTVNAQAEKISVKVAMFPLLSGTISVSDISLINPNVEVSERTQNQEQLNEVQAEESTANNASSNNLMIDRLYIEDANISYKPLDGEAMKVAIPAMTLSADSAKGPFGFDGRINYQDMNLNVKGQIGQFSTETATPVNITVNDRAYSLAFDGVADTSGDQAAIQGNINLSVSSMAKLAAQFGSDDLPIKDQSLALTGLIAGNSNAIKLDNGQLKLGSIQNAMPVAFAYSLENKNGTVRLQQLPGGGAVDLDISQTETMNLAGQIQLPNLKALLVDALGVVEASTFDNPQIPNSAVGDIRASLGDTITLTSQSMELGSYSLRGTSLNYVPGDAPKVNLAIQNFEGANVRLSGTLDEDQGVNAVISHPNAAQFIKIFQPDFESSPNLEQPFSFKGVILKDGDTMTIRGMDAKIGSIDADGQISLNMAAAIPAITANLTFGNLDTQALLTGKKSDAAISGGGAGSAKSTGAPWTRDAIDTSFLRSINLDLNAKANQLIHGTWVITNPTIDIDINNGTLIADNISGGLFGGSVSVKGKAEARAEGQPLSISANITAENVNLANLVKAATAQTQERVRGTGNFNIALNASGLSSSALIYSLNGDGRISTSPLVINGINLSKITESISDESLTDLQSAFEGGQTNFQAVDHPFTIREGTMPINDLRLVSDTAALIANGNVSFAGWTMNVTNTIEFLPPYDDLPNLSMTIKGPLNAPQQNVATDILRSFIVNKYGAKVQNKINEKVDEFIGDKLGADTPAAGIINNLLGRPQPAPRQQQDQTVPQPEETQDTPAANDNVEPTPEEEVEPQAQQSPEEQILRGVFDAIGQ